MKQMLLALSMLSLGLWGYAQSVELSATSLPATTLKNNAGDEYGKGSMQKYKARISAPFYYKKDSLGRINLWSLTAAGSLGVFSNSGEANGMTPSRIMNTSLALTHVMPVGRTWSLMAQLGAGVYGEPDNIRWNTVLLRGGAILAHRFSSRLNAGLGASFTTLYGSPIVIPAVMVQYDDNHTYTLDLTVQSGANITAGMRLSNALAVKLTAFEWESLPAVALRQGHWRVYSSTMFRSYISPELHFAKKSWLSLQAGYNYHRSATFKKRRPSSFLGHIPDRDNREFKPSLLLGATLHIGL